METGNEIISYACPYCGQAIYGTAADIDSGVRKHFEYCEEKEKAEIEDKDGE